MKHMIALILAAFTLSGCARLHRFDAPVDHQPEARQIADTTVALVEPDEDDPSTARAYCSGVWVSPTHILTAAHCVVDDLEVGDVVRYSGKADTKYEAHVRYHSAFVAAIDAPHDLALLHTLFVTEHPIAHVAFGVTQGQFVQTMGKSLGLWWSYSNGSVGAIRHWSKPASPFDATPVADAPDMLWVQTTTPVSGGNSGGGLFDEYGDLVGICHGSFTRAQNVNLFVHRDHVAAFLRAQKVSS